MIFHNQKGSSTHLYRKPVMYKGQVIDDLFLSMLVSNYGEQILTITLGQMIKFSNEK